MKKSILLLVVSIVIAGRAFAQASLPMIVSSSALRDNAYAQATQVYGVSYATTVAYDGSQSITWSGEKSADQIGALAKSLDLSSTIINTSDLVTVDLVVYNSDNDSLFAGRSSGNLVQKSGKWSLVTGPMNMGLLPVPIRFDKQVSGAQIRPNGDSSQSGWANLRVSGNKVYFPPESAGLVGANLVVYFTDATARTYDIAGGALKSDISYTAGVSPVWDNTLIFKDQSTVKATVASIKGVGTVPTIEATYSGMTSVTFDVSTSEGKRPTVLWVRVLGSSSYEAIPVPSSGMVVKVMPAGTVHVVPQWDSKDFQEPTSALDTNGDGGKG